MSIIDAVARYRPVDSAQSFPELEQLVLSRWRERDVFHESIRRREGAPPYVFYEGPPTANGRPGSHHVLARVFKDVFPRYKTMRGHFVPRKGGWDCHGLPVELEVERELGFTSKDDIERYGVAEFNAKCRESVLRYIDEWNELTERIGFWVDTDDAYFTLDNDYVESVWWSLKEVWKQGLLTQGHKVVPYCTRCGTALSSHELAMGYRDVVDPSVYVRFPLVDEPGVSLLAWTTMPWTLVPHAAIAVDPEVTYVRARHEGETLILAEALAERVLGEGAEAETTMKGSDLLGLRYEPPFPYIGDYGERGHTVLAGDFVSVEDGTGVVHTGAAFGEDDFRLATENGLTVHNPVRPDGTFDDRAGPFAGDVRQGRRRADRRGAARVRPAVPRRRVRARLPALLALRHAAHLLRQDDLVRAHDRAQARSCSRPTRRSPGTPSTSSTGASATGSRTTSTGRCRASATGARRCRCGAAARGTSVCIGSMRRDRASAAATPPEDLHRPYIDEVVLPCEECGGEMRRVPEVIDVWWDSGCDAVRAVARAVRERGAVRASASPRTTSARGSTRRAAGSTRCSRSRRCCPASPSYRDLPVPRPDPRPRRPEDVEVEGQRRRAVGRARTSTARTPSAGTTSPRSSRGTATASRSRRSASPSASS